MCKCANVETCLPAGRCGNSPTRFYGTQIFMVVMIKSECIFFGDDRRGWACPSPMAH